MSRDVLGPGSLPHRQCRRNIGFAGSSTGAPDLATIVAVGPFGDLEHARHLAAMLVAVQQPGPTRLVMLGTGAGCSVVSGCATQHGLQRRLVLVEDSVGPQRSQWLAASAVVIPSPGVAPAALVEVMAAGRAVVASASPATALLVMPNSAGLLYGPGDVWKMIAAVVRLLTHAELCHQMGNRAIQVAQYHHRSVVDAPWCNEDRAPA